MFADENNLKLERSNAMIGISPPEYNSDIEDTGVSEIMEEKNVRFAEDVSANNIQLFKNGNIFILADNSASVQPHTQELAESFNIIISNTLNNLPLDINPAITTYFFGNFCIKQDKFCGKLNNVPKMVREDIKNGGQTALNSSIYHLLSLMNENDVLSVITDGYDNTILPVSNKGEIYTNGGLYVSDNDIKKKKGSKQIFFVKIGKESLNEVNFIHQNKGFDKVFSSDNYNDMSIPLARQLSRAVSQPSPNHEFN